MKPRALVLHATGTNRDHEAALALEQAGAQPDIVPLTQLRTGEKQWSHYQLVVLPGGFAYADALGAGKLLALDLNLYFADAVNEFVVQKKPIIGICNGFQALIKANILPALSHASSKEATRTPSPLEGEGTNADADATTAKRVGVGEWGEVAQSSEVRATLTFNAQGHFECRWVTLKPVSQKCIWTRDLDELIYCPVAHGEGNFQLAHDADLETLRANDQIALRYASENGGAANGAYPFNPNGSIDDIAGVCNDYGNVLGLMPHPEDHIFHYQHPRHTRGERRQLGLQLFVNGVQYAAQL
jgi:phosphoribosylformylglycinamidine synthase subunit PurQ / glutaminase